MKDLKFALSLMTPAVWLSVLLAALVLAGAGGFVGYRVGHSVADGIAQIAALKVDGERAAERLAAVKAELAHGKALAAEVAKVATIEQQWKDDLGDVALTHKEKMDEASAKIKSLTADVLTGAVRLSVAVKAGPGTCHFAPGEDPAAAGGNQETRAELVPQVAYDLIGIAADGDDAVRDLNACIDSYHAIEQKQAQQ